MTKSENGIAPGTTATAGLLGDYVDAATLARLLKVSRRTVDRWRKQPDGLAFTTMGARVLVSVSGFRAWLAARETRPNRRRRSAA